MAGNAREWCANEAGDRRVTRGGACNGPAYLFRDVEARPPLERDPTTGFRCMVPLEPASVPATLDEPTPPAPRWREVQPFSDETWRTWQACVAYPRSPLAARVEAVDESSPYWRRETVTFDAAYGGERVLAYLYLPRTAKPPYQTVVFWPGATVLRFASSERGRSICDTGVWGYLVKDGRALLYPILKGTYDRGGGAEVTASQEQWVMQVKDVSRSLDYLETRDDVDADRIGYLGFSWGAYMGTLACASDARFKVAVLRCGGLTQARGNEVLGWADRVRLPVQMVNGRFDSLFPAEDNSSVLFDALGTAGSDKRHVLLPSDHQLTGQQREVMKVELEWFDRYLGPVRR
jgi:dienelactone hydrolase